MMWRLCSILIFTIITRLGYSQALVYQDVCHCGVTAAGFSTGLGFGSGSFNVHIEPGSTIKKAYILSYRVGYPPLVSFLLNSVPFTYDTTSYFTKFNHKNPYFSPIFLHYKDITQSINSAISNYTITIPTQLGLPINWGYWTFFLYIVYEKPTLPKVSFSIIANNQFLKGNEIYSINNLNPINNSFPVGFSIYSDRMTGALSPYSYNVFFNSTNIGNVGVISDNVNSPWGAAGTKGHFYYQNNTLFGLDDDTPDNLVFQSDGLADVSAYLTNNSTSSNFELIHTNYPNNAAISTGVELAYFLTYTTPCDTFSVNLLTEDTTICRGTSVQLGVSGGNTSLSKPAYEWLPQKDLSCYNCANPVFTGDSSQVYTVRIWNTDSCSKVLPVRVKVLPQPQFTSIALTPTSCGELQGKIVAKSNSTTDSLFLAGNFVGFAPQTLQNMGGGNYTLFLKDTNGCVSKDTSVTINSVNLTNALFTLNPTTGAVPLAVSSDNQSTHATDYSWCFLNDSTTVFAPNMQFDTSGTYTVTLVAYNNTPDCSDTFSLQIIVYDSLQIIIPNVFTPNGDNQNDVFSIQVNAPCTGTITLTNRWGNELFSKNFTADGKEKITLWDSMTTNGKASDGVYFYLLKLQDKKGKNYRFQGFVEVFH